MAYKIETSTAWWCSSIFNAQQLHKNLNSILRSQAPIFFAFYFAECQLSLSLKLNFSFGARFGI